MAKKKFMGTMENALSQPARATFASERGTGALDNLTMDVLEAEALGYGCRYGNYKADHPSTKALREAYEEDKKRKEQIGNEKICTHCSEAFFTKTAHKLCPTCRAIPYNTRKKERREQEKNGSAVEN